MSFDTHGFFSPAIENFRSSIRQVPDYKLWFDFADGLNRLGLDMGAVRGVVGIAGGVVSG
jgi:hypothetical protein